MYVLIDQEQGAYLALSSSISKFNLDLCKRVHLSDSKLSFWHKQRTHGQEAKYTQNKSIWENDVPTHFT